ncbi:MAG: hypothetical protein HY238_20705 [Acidobacteria bacterium]|nr:hypothetical protein [Acidobacteriota bacterium]
MDDRKYRQRGYMDSDRDREKRPERPRTQGPRTQGPPGGDRIGPRTPKFPPRVTVARCASCGTLLPKGFDPNGQCAKCRFELHCCKQCVHFDTSTRWECTQPIPARVSPKDVLNDCTFYEIRMSSERETTSGGSAGAPGPSRPDDPRQAFENLFKK